MATEDPKSYIAPTVLALLLHAGLILLLVWQWPREVEPHRLTQPKAIQAKMVAQDPAQVRAEAIRRTAEEQRRLEEAKRREAQRQAELKRRQEEAARQRQLEQQRRQEAERQRRLAEQRRKKEAEAKRKAEEQRRLAEQKRLAEERRKQEEAKRRAEEEARRQAEQKRLAEERRKQEEAKRKREEEARRLAEQRRLEQERKQQELNAFNQALAAEEEFLQALTDAEKVDAHAALIKSYVEQSWSRPPGARQGMRVILKVHLVPTGEVAGVSILQSSGDDAFDRSVEQAVRRAAPFRELRELEPRLFERNFRELTFDFSPEDLPR